ncbi:MAG: hypothetical protein FJX71_02070 [Alphaproteobacteria bacterium]|nr:hypothetical protein [Alphaproteobacteria bacterium]
MLRGLFNKLVAIGVSCGLMSAAIAAPAPSGGTGAGIGSGGGGGGGPLVYSKLTTRQLSQKVSGRYYVSQDFAHQKDYNPLYPSNSSPLYTFVGAEYFPTPMSSLGALAFYTQQKEIYTLVNATQKMKSSGIMPYYSHMLSRSWLVTGQLGIYVNDYNLLNYTPGGIVKLRRQTIQPYVGGYFTWIGPDRPVTASVRTGLLYTNERYRQAWDSTQTYLYPGRHFETIQASASFRLKYKPKDTFWDVYFQGEVGHRILASSRPYVWRPDSGIQNMLYQFGPGMHININQTWEVRMMYLHTVGYGYVKDDRIGIRLRAAV